MNDLLHSEEISVSDPVVEPAAVTLQSGMAFLAENPEAFGSVTDVYPVATDEWLIAVQGRSASGSAVSPTYPMAAGGGVGLLDGMFAGMVNANDSVKTILKSTFGETSKREEHPVSRYAAALVEMTALRIISELEADATAEETARRFGTELPLVLSDLREVICRDKLTAHGAEFYTVSMGACRLKNLGKGNYLLDLFLSGKFSAYILDAEGMRPLPVPRAAELSPESEGGVMVGKRIRLRHPEPFSLLLLSGGATAINVAEQRALRENAGLIWHYRMRLETYILRIMTACALANEFGARAARFFTGRLQGDESASGAMILCATDLPYSAIRADCLSRLRHVEDMLALLPDGYDPNRVNRLPSRADTEKAYVRRLLAQERGLVSRVGEALRLLALDKLARLDSPTEPPDPPAEAPEFRRLTPADIYEAYRLYDVENDADRALLKENHRALRDHFSDHWITLRPALALLYEGDAVDDADPATLAAAVQAERAYEMCLTLNARLGDCLAERRRKQYRLKGLLAEGLRVLSTEENDWLSGRACPEQTAAWAELLAADIPDAVEDYLADRAADTDRCRSLLAAYMTERDRLFIHDTTAPHGFFAADWSAIMAGTLPEARWGELHAAAATADLDAPDGTTPYTDLMETLRRISTGVGFLITRIRARAADQRMARDLANRLDLQIAAIRASAYEDPDWGMDICAVLDTSHRNNYFTVVRRWQETKELMAKQAAAYEEYRALYE